MTNPATCWPGTKTPKSTGNAFDWRNTSGELTKRMLESQVKAAAGLKGASSQQQKGVHFNGPLKT